MTEETKDNMNVKDKKWKFDEDVTNCFDNMLERSIPQYKLMRELTFRVGSKFVKIGTNIVDIGCSSGRAIEPFAKQFGLDVDFYLYDVSEPMLAKAKENLGYMNIEKYDITNGINVPNSSLILSVLTLQFTPIEYREKIVQSVYDSLNKGGAFILIEKVLGNTYQIDEILVNEYYNVKRENSYTEEQIADKRKSLEGVLVPITADWNMDLLHKAGFSQVDCFWRCLNFAGWIAIK